MEDNLEIIQNLNNETDGLADKDFLTYMLDHFNSKIAFASSFG